MRFVLFCLLALLFYASCGEAPGDFESEKRPAVAPGKPAAPGPKITSVPDSVCIAAVGDIMLGTSYPDARTLPPDGAKNSFKNVLDEWRGADVKFGNLEGTLLDTGAPAHFKLHQLSKSWLFR